MRVLVYPHTMEIGGCQLNAVETAGALRDRGHDVSVISAPGPLVELVGRLGLTHIPLDPRSRRRPSPRAAAQLTRLVREQKFDIVHGYEWPPGVEAFAGAEAAARPARPVHRLLDGRRPVPAAHDAADREHR